MINETDFQGSRAGATWRWAGSLLLGLYACAALWALPAVGHAEPVTRVTASVSIPLSAPPEFPPRSEVPPSEFMVFAYPSDGLSIDTSNREAVRVFYNGLYPQSDGVGINWTGAHSACNAGTTGQLYQNAVSLRINWFRAMAGLSANVNLYGPYNTQAQQAALVMSTNDSLSHAPPSSWNCWNQTAYDAAGKSNLALGNLGPDAVSEGYLRDPGSNNAAVGHRRWVLYPQTQNMGTGDVPSGLYNAASVSGANALWVFDSHIYDSRPATRDDFVAWPPKGYVPYPVVYGRWSLSHSSASFSGATVSVKKGGVSTPVSVETLHNGYGENTIVWLLQGVNDSTVWPKPANDEIYEVTVANVVVNGVARTFKYNVTVFDPDVPTPGARQTTVTAPPSATTNGAFTASIAGMTGATSYQMALYRLGGLSQVITPSTSSSFWSYVTGPGSAYNPIEATSFHLYHADFAPQSLTLNKKLHIGQNASLSFLSWFTYATAGQIARAQISLDDGLSWRDIYVEAGSNATSPATKVIDLASFAGRFAQVRFVFSYVMGMNVYYQPSTGWFFNNIRLTNISERLDGQLVNVSATSAEASFTVGSAGNYALAAKTEYQGVYFTDWGTTSVFPVTTESATRTLSLASGWNLLGNGSSGSIDVPVIFGDMAKVNSVWKWLPASGKWAFYAPSLSGQGLADYVGSKGYAALESIRAGEGFWVNAKTAFPVTVGSGSVVTTAQLAPTLAQGWNLVAIGESPQTPSHFNAALGYDIGSLWAWDAQQSRWYFYAPSLEQSGALNAYINDHLYLDFTRQGKTLGWGSGFWVRNP